MAKEKRYYWVRLEKDFFKDPVIKKFKKMKHGCDMIVFYEEFILDSLDTGGIIVFEGVEDTLEAELALKYDTEPEIVSAALSVLKKAGRIEEDEDGDLDHHIPERFFGSITDAAIRKRKSRENKGKPVTECDVVTDSHNRSLYIDIDIDKEKDNNDYLKRMSEASELLAYLNQQIAGKPFDAEYQLKAIAKQLTKNTPEEIRKVFSYCARNWKNDPEHMDYLNPNGICSSRFSQSLSEAEAEEQQKAKELESCY